MSKPVLAVGLLAVMAGAWYWALLPLHVPAPPARAPTAVGNTAAGAVPAVRLERLATRAVPVLQGDDARNPFGGGVVAMSGAPPASHRDRVIPSTVASPPKDVPAPEWPRVELIGVAEGREGAALVRTAVVSGPQGVHHVRTGDLLEGVYRVERIATDGVDVRLLPEDRVVRLSLRP